MLGVLGSHGSGGSSGEGDPVQALAYCTQRQLLASAGLDDTVGTFLCRVLMLDSSVQCDGAVGQFPKLGRQLPLAHFGMPYA